MSQRGDLSICSSQLTVIVINPTLIICLTVPNFKWLVYVACGKWEDTSCMVFRGKVQAPQISAEFVILLRFYTSLFDRCTLSEYPVTKDHKANTNRSSIRHITNRGLPNQSTEATGWLFVSYKTTTHSQVEYLKYLFHSPSIMSYGISVIPSERSLGINLGRFKLVWTRNEHVYTWFAQCITSLSKRCTDWTLAAKTFHIWACDKADTSWIDDLTFCDKNGSEHAPEPAIHHELFTFELYLRADNEIKRRSLI